MDKMKLEYEAGKPIIKMEHDGVKVLVSFTDNEPETDTKGAITDILTAQYTDRLTDTNARVQK